MDTLNDALYGRNVYRDGEEEERANREPPVEVEEDDPPPEVPPPMTLVLLCVGTYGDVQPFVLIAKRLQQDGHRVRVASHPEYRPFIVNQNGLEFYPLGGDPRALSALLVKTGGWLMPNAFTDADQEWYSASFEMIGEIMVSSWPACTEPDPGDPQKRPFVADAILANPVAYGHIHCAEALNVPLHLLFLQPWTPTVSFPHPFSNLPYSIKNTAVNRLSYFAVDGFFWTMVRLRLLFTQPLKLILTRRSLRSPNRPGDVLRRGGGGGAALKRGGARREQAVPDPPRRRRLWERHGVDRRRHSRGLGGVPGLGPRGDHRFLRWRPPDGHEPLRRVRFHLHART